MRFDFFAFFSILFHIFYSILFFRFLSSLNAVDGLKRKEIPQMILLTFDDAVNDLNFPLYQEIFDSNDRKPIRTNPNGCPIRATFFVSHEWTDYSKVQTLYARGHEIGSHSVT